VNPDFNENLFIKKNASALFNMILSKMRDIVLYKSIKRDDPEETANRWLSSIDVVYRFVKERLVRDPKWIIGKNEFYGIFIEFCESLDLPVPDKDGFYKRLFRYGGKSYRPRDQEGKRPLFIIGWRIKNDNLGEEIL